MKLNKKNLYWLALTVVVIALDQLTKQLIVAHLQYGRPLEILSMFNLTLTHNPGAAFSFLSAAGGWQRWLFTGIAIAVSLYILFWLMRAEKHEYAIKAGLSLVLGGALGNLFDRLHYGYVIDFIQIHFQNWYYPDFNVADSAITLGAIFIIWALIFSKKDQTKS